MDFCVFPWNLLSPVGLLTIGTCVAVTKKGSINGIYVNNNKISSIKDTKQRFLAIEWSMASRGGGGGAGWMDMHEWRCGWGSKECCTAFFNLLDKCNGPEFPWARTNRCDLVTIYRLRIRVEIISISSICPRMVVWSIKVATFIVQTL